MTQHPRNGQPKRSTSASSQSMDQGSAHGEREASGNAPPHDPVGCTNPQKPLESQHFSHAGDQTCSTSVLHTTPSPNDLSHCLSAGFSGIRCGTGVYHKRLSGIWRRGAIYQLRIRVPADIVTIVGKTHINRTLGTASYRDALKRCRLLTSEIVDAFESWRTGAPSTLTLAARPSDNRSAPPISSATRGITLIDAWD